MQNEHNDLGDADDFNHSSIASGSEDTFSARVRGLLSTNEVSVATRRLEHGTADEQFIELVIGSRSPLDHLRLPETWTQSQESGAYIASRQLRVSDDFVSTIPAELNTNLNEIGTAGGTEEAIISQLLTVYRSRPTITNTRSYMTRVLISLLDAPPTKSLLFMPNIPRDRLLPLRTALHITREIMLGIRNTSLETVAEIALDSTPTLHILDGERLIASWINLCMASVAERELYDRLSSFDRFINQQELTESDRREAEAIDRASTRVISASTEAMQFWNWMIRRRR